MIFYASMNTEGLIHDAITSKIYLGRMIDSLNTIIMDVLYEPDRAEDVLRAYKLFFDVLQKELEEWRIEKVQIGMALDVTGCGVAKTIEMTPRSFFASFKERREECTLQDVLEDMYQPEHVIGLVASAITRQHNRLLIDDLKSGIKYVSDLVASKGKICENSDSLSFVNETDKHVINVGNSPTAREQADIGTDSVPSFDSKKVGGSKETFNSREYNDGQSKK